MEGTASVEEDGIGGDEGVRVDTDVGTVPAPVALGPFLWVLLLIGLVAYVVYQSSDRRRLEEKRRPPRKRKKVRRARARAGDGVAEREQNMGEPSDEVPSQEQHRRQGEGDMEKRERWDEPPLCSPLKVAEGTRTPDAHVAGTGARKRRNATKQSPAAKEFTPRPQRQTNQRNKEHLDYAAATTGDDRRGKSAESAGTRQTGDSEEWDVHIKDRNGECKDAERSESEVSEVSDEEDVTERNLRLREKRRQAFRQQEEDIRAKARVQAEKRRLHTLANVAKKEKEANLTRGYRLDQGLSSYERERLEALRAEREERQRLRELQDAAYRASLNADRLGAHVRQGNGTSQGRAGTIEEECEDEDDDNRSDEDAGDAEDGWFDGRAAPSKQADAVEKEPEPSGGVLVSERLLNAARRREKYLKQQQQQQK